jgi:hypothetical protein
MRRRRLLQLGAASLAISGSGVLRAAYAAPKVLSLWIRPGDPNWPTGTEWNELRQRVGGNLLKLESPLNVCRAAADSKACRDLFRELKNSYFIGDSPTLTQTCGWVDAWTAQPSAYAIAARNTADVVAGANFAREKNLRLVIKGGGHSYPGTSNAPDSLLIWTRPIHDIWVEDAFVPHGGAGQVGPVPAVTVGAGAIWMHTYDAVTTGAGRYVQGGGCGTVAGLVQGGGVGNLFQGVRHRRGLVAGGGDCHG